MPPMPSKQTMPQQINDVLGAVGLAQVTVHPQWSGSLMAPQCMQQTHNKIHRPHVMWGASVIGHAISHIFFCCVRSRRRCRLLVALPCSSWVAEHRCRPRHAQTAHLPCSNHDAMWRSSAGPMWNRLVDRRQCGVRRHQRRRREALRMGHWCCLFGQSYALIGRAWACRWTCV